MDFIKKIQGLPEDTRKIILWVLLSVIGVLLFFLWGWNSIRTVKNMDKDSLLNDMKVPELTTEFQDSIDEINEKTENMEDFFDDLELEDALEEEALNEE